jgi:methionyl-tRNA formyltransferase
VPDEIINNFECVCFHSSDVPYGRGGSPIQNLIIRGFTETKISALRMVKELDAGPVYMKNPLKLEGTAQSIFEDSATIVADMMKYISQNEPEPINQEGEPVVFKRLKNDDNILPLNGELNYLYNHIRMLDAESYPNSFIHYGDFKLEFSGASIREEMLEAKVRITRKN